MRTRAAVRPSRACWRRVDAERVDLLAAEQAEVGVPGKPDDDRPLELLSARLDAEPRRLVGRGDMRFLADPLRPDDDVGQVELDVRKRRQELCVETRRSLVTLPAVS